MDRTNLSAQIPSVSILWLTLPINATGSELDSTENEIVPFEKEVRILGRHGLSDRSLRRVCRRGPQRTLRLTTKGGHYGPIVIV